MQGGKQASNKATRTSNDAADDAKVVRENWRKTKVRAKGCALRRLAVRRIMK